MKATLPPDWAQLANALYRKGMNDEEVSLLLLEKGAGEAQLREIIQEVKKTRTTRRRNSGFLFCGIGVFLLVIGCLLTLVLFNNGGNIRLVMYGLTTIGLAFTIKGMIDLLGW